MLERRLLQEIHIGVESFKELDPQTSISRNGDSATARLENLNNLELLLWASPGKNKFVELRYGILH